MSDSSKVLLWLALSQGSPMAVVRLLLPTARRAPELLHDLHKAQNEAKYDDTREEGFAL